LKVSFEGYLFWNIEDKIKSLQRKKYWLPIKLDWSQSYTLWYVLYIAHSITNKLYLITLLNLSQIKKSYGFSIIGLVFSKNLIIHQCLFISLFESASRHRFLFFISNLNLDR